MTENVIELTDATFDEEHAYENAKELLLKAIGNYKNRDRSKMAIPNHKKPLVA